ncbi:hypothetical protein R5R73_05810 [Salinicola sp. LHM]|uniref:hypothetical protein n=1 Tax=Salinicola sp. LHM TaxID=3065298 RepID=UPI002ACDA781|nr:hypothetical protein [Salinicola sp. LHM]WQH34202.1 hypothetical protein R5R73_05810 [Salinicola sp. LHM]
MKNVLFLMAFLAFFAAILFFLDWLLEKLNVKRKHDDKLLWIIIGVIVLSFIAVFGLEGYEQLPWEDRVLRR